MIGTVASLKKTLVDVYLSVWLAGAAGLLLHFVWSMALAAIIGNQVGQNNDFWTGVHFGFTMLSALPVAFTCACIWGLGRKANLSRQYPIWMLVACFSTVAFEVTLRPGFELWFAISDCVSLAVGPIVLMFISRDLTGRRRKRCSTCESLP